MPLTVTEKNEWKRLIENRIDRRIERLWNEAGDLKKDLKDKAHQAVLHEMGLHTLLAELEQLKELSKQAEKRVEAKSAEIHRKVLGETWTELPYRRNDDISRIDSTVDSRVKTKFQDLAATTAVGAEVQKLQKEREQILEAVWITTAPSELRKLWAHLKSIVGDDQTELETVAASITTSE